MENLGQKPIACSNKCSPEGNRRDGAPRFADEKNEVGKDEGGDILSIGMTMEVFQSEGKTLVERGVKMIEKGTKIK